MGATEIAAFVIIAGIPCGVWIWCKWREGSANVDNGIRITLANGLDDFDEDGTDPQMETRIVGKHRKETC